MLQNTTPLLILGISVSCFHTMRTLKTICVLTNFKVIYYILYIVFLLQLPKRTILTFCPKNKTHHLISMTAFGFYPRGALPLHGRFYVQF